MEEPTGQYTTACLCCGFREVLSVCSEPYWGDMDPYSCYTDARAVTLQEMEAALPAKVKRQLAALKPQLYLVDARTVADSVGLGKRINMVMQTVFFQLSGVVPMDKVGGWKAFSVSLEPVMTVTT